MKISIVITTYNRRDSLERCLKSLAEQTCPFNDFEVVVVADGCTDGTVDLLGSYAPPHAFLWLNQQNQGQPAAQNAGVALASGDVVLFLDDDCVSDPGLITAHVEAHRESEKILVVGAVLLHPDTPAGTMSDLKGELEESEVRRLSTNGVNRLDMMLCANSSIARHAALSCPFDPAYQRMHDVEAGLRLWAMGYRPRFAPKAIAYELFTKSISGVLSDSRFQGKYEVFLANKHPEFKPLATLVRINEGSPLKRWLRKQMSIHARVSEIALQMAYSVTETMRKFAPFASLAHRVLRARIGLQHVRGAIDEAGSWKKLEQQFGVRIPVIAYHNVGVPRPDEYPGLTTPVPGFEAQIKLLSKMGYSAILPEDWLRWRDEGAALPEKPVMLVFDDAYDEAASQGFPLLQHYGFRAACMVVTSCIGATNRWDEEAGRPSFQLMTKEQILEWSQKGIEFGGHTSRHPELPLESDDRVEQEIAQCKQDLTMLLRKPPASFAYPFGGLSPAAEAAVSRHFQLGFTSWPGRLHLATNPALVPRIAFLPGESKFGMACRLRFGRNPLEVIRNRWRKLTGSSRPEPYGSPQPASDQR